MGFGLLIVGFLAVFGVMPDSFMYYGYFIVIPLGGALVMLYAFARLGYFNIYFKVSKYLTLFLLAMLVSVMPFSMLNGGEYLTEQFMFVFKLVRILYFFAFFYILLHGILHLAADIENPIITRITKRNIVLTYIYFILPLVPLFIDFGDYTKNYALISFACGFIYYVIILVNILSCYKRITFEGHDEAQDKKYKLEKRERSAGTPKKKKR